MRIPAARSAKSLSRCQSDIASAQERCAGLDKIPEVQADALDAGRRGARCPKAPTPDGWAAGGVAALTRTDVQVTRAPVLNCGAIEGGRALAADVHAAMSGGSISTPVRVASPRDLAITYPVAQRLRKVAAGDVCQVVVYPPAGPHCNEPPAGSSHPLRGRPHDVHRERARAPKSLLRV